MKGLLRSLCDRVIEHPAAASWKRLIIRMNSTFGDLSYLPSAVHVQIPYNVNPTFDCYRMVCVQVYIN